MINGAEWALQKALYDELTNDTTIMSLVQGVYDEPPTDANYPYIILGDFITTPANVLLYVGKNINAMFHVYTKPAGLGYYEAKNIIDNMQRVLDHKKFAVEGYNNVICKLDKTNYEKDEDKRIGWVSFDIILHNRTTIITY